MANKLAKLLAKHLGKQKLLGFGALTLTKVTAGSRLPDAQSAGTNPTTADYPCKGRLGIKQATVVKGGTLAQVSVLTVSILGATLPDGTEPNPGDRISKDGVTYVIVPDGVSNRDGLGAVYDCAVRQQ